MTAVVAQHNGLLPFGWIGVWLFFVISGYVVTLSVICRSPAASRSDGLKRFYERRARRIIPVYYAYILMGILFCIATASDIDFLAVLSLAGFFNNVAMALARGELPFWPVGHLWTISIEMQFYAVYGVLLFFATPRKLVLLLIGALLAAPLMRFAASGFVAGLGWESGANAYAIYSGSFLHTDAFALGALLAFSASNGALARIARPLAAVGCFSIASYATIYVCLNFAAGERGIDMFRNVVSGIVWGQFREVFLYSAVIAASGGLVALSAIKDPLIHWAVRSPILQRIGEISYGAYIYHGLAIWITIVVTEELFAWPAEDRAVSWRIVQFFISYTITIAAAELSFRYFESFFIKHRPSQVTRAELAEGSNF